MFYKINPRASQVAFDLGADGFLVGDKVWVRLQGDFQPAVNGSTAVDDSQNTSFTLGGNSFTASLPITVKAKDTVLVATNLDDPLADNTDPDHDYGVRVKLAAFSNDNDTFRFLGRAVLPSEIQGSIHNAGAGNDRVYMPDAPVEGFDTAWLFNAGAGDDRVIAGDLGLRLDMGTGVDTLALSGASINWGNAENRDNDGTLVLMTAAGTRYRVSNAEILQSGHKEDLLLKWNFQLVRGDDGQVRLNFFENGKLVTSGNGFYDEALPVPQGSYKASFHRDGWMGERIELAGVSGFDDVVIRKGSGGADTEGNFVTTAAFLNSVFGHIEEAYDQIGRAVPWKQGALHPLVPVTASVGSDIEQPFLKMKNLVTDDHGNAAVTPRISLMQAGDIPGLANKSIQVFFTAEGTAERLVDWDFLGGTKAYTGDDFAPGVLRQGTDGDGNRVYSVMLERGSSSLGLPLRIIGDNQHEGNETIRFEVVDIDLWRDNGARANIYHLSGGPGADKERDFDGPTGLEHGLLPDNDFVVTIHDNLIT